jgi:hypothetical protein
LLATCCFSEISSERTLLEDRISMAVSSSKMLPCNIKAKYTELTQSVHKIGPHPRLIGKIYRANSKCT